LVDYSTVPDRDSEVHTDYSNGNSLTVGVSLRLAVHWATTGCAHSQAR
jgi:hypothetical protein